MNLLSSVMCLSFLNSQYSQPSVEPLLKVFLTSSAKNISLWRLVHGKDDRAGVPAAVRGTKTNLKSAISRELEEVKAPLMSKIGGTCAPTNQEFPWKGNEV